MASSAKLKFPSLRRDGFGDRSRPLESRHLDGIYKRVAKVTGFLSNPKLGLEVYQPFILETLPEIVTKLRQVWSHYESVDRVMDLSYNEFFRTYMESLDAKVRELKVLCRQNKADMCNSTSKPRITLIRMSMALSYLFKDFKVFFPSNEFTDNFKITKQEAAEWWARNFGDRVLVPWHEFQYRFGSEHSISSFEEAQCLKRDIDITLNDYVSKFEFDVFTRLFMPWSNILNTWKMLAVKHPAYVNMTYEEVKKCLEELCDRPASFVFRRSCTKLGFWSIGFVSYSRKVNQTVIRDGKSIVEALIEGAEQRLYLYPKGMEPTAAPDLRFLLSCRAKEQISVSAEEFEIYSNMDSSFELCKICSENNKDLKLEPCGHLLCRACFKDWSQKLNRYDKTSSCPFCRAEIRSTQYIEISPFRPVSTAVAREPLPALPSPSQPPALPLPGGTVAATAVVAAPVSAATPVGDLIDLSEVPPPLPLRIAERAAAVSSATEASGGGVADPFGPLANGGDAAEATGGGGGPAGTVWEDFGVYDMPKTT